MTTPIERYEGRDVVATTVAITNAGDGLSEAMKTEPKVLHHFDTVYLVLECEVAKVRYDKAKGDETEDLVRVHVLKAGTATFVEASLVDALIREQAEKNKRAREREQGVQRLDDYAEDLEALTEEHNAGGHDGLKVDGCPECTTAATADVAPIAGRRDRKRKEETGGDEAVI